LVHKSASARSVEHGDVGWCGSDWVVAVTVDNNDVEEAVAVKVADREILWHDPHGKARLRAEGAVTVVQENGYVVTALVGGDQVGVTVAIQIGNSDAVR